MSSPSSRSAGRHNRTAAAAAARRGADANSRGTQTEAEVEAEVAATAIAAPVPSDGDDLNAAERAAAEKSIMDTDDALLLIKKGVLDRIADYDPNATDEEKDKADTANVMGINSYWLDSAADQMSKSRAARSAAPAPIDASTDRLQQLFAQEDEEDAAFRAEIQAQYDSARREVLRRQLTECLEGQTAKVQIYQKFQQQAASSGDESAALPSFNCEEILAQIETDLADLQQQEQQQQGGDIDEILGRYRERDAVLTEALNEVRAKQAKQEQKKLREQDEKKEQKRQKQIDDLTASMSALQLEMTALRDQNTTLAVDVGRLRDQNATLTDDVGRLRDQNDVHSADLVAVRAQVQRLEKQQAEAGAGGSDGGQEEEKKDQE